MSTPSPPTLQAPSRAVDSDQDRLRLYFYVLAVSLTLFIAGLSAIEYLEARSNAVEQAKVDCLASFNKDLIYRRWASGHGGVYVPATEDTPPNPYLEHLAERDITTPSGKRLTLINPAYMTRQVFEMGKDQYGPQGHITSLNPIRPENAPDAWEAKALQEFAAGSKESVSVEMFEGEPYVRMIRPMKTEAACLKCHAQQGYKLGDIRGGISVSVPLTPYVKAALHHANAVFWGYGIVWAVGLTGLWITKTRFQRTLQVRRQTEENLRVSEARYKNFFEHNYSVMLVIDPTDGDIVDANPAASAFYGWTRDELKQKKISEINTMTTEEIAVEMARAKDQTRTYFIFQHHLADGTVRDVEVYSGPLQTAAKTLLFSIVHDITDRKRAEQALQYSLQEKEVLLKEIHHRVKNNMQVIYSLLNLQANNIKDDTVRAMFEESKNRINSMALIHDKLYRSKEFAFVDFKEYLLSLVGGIADTYKRYDIILAVEMEPLAVDVNTGIPCGLIVNELVTNSLKHAFPNGRKGTVKLGIKRDSAGHNVLTVADDGIGLPAEVDFRHTPSLGLLLVNVLSGQLHASIELSREGGTKFSITFPGKPQGLASDSA